MSTRALIIAPAALVPPALDSWASARNGKWHRTANPEPSWARDETALCGITFRPLNVTHHEEPPTRPQHICKHCERAYRKANRAEVPA